MQLLALALCALIASVSALTSAPCKIARSLHPSSLLSTRTRAPLALGMSPVTQPREPIQSAFKGSPVVIASDYRVAAGFWLVTALLAKVCRSVEASVKALI